MVSNPVVMSLFRRPCLAMGGGGTGIDSSDGRTAILMFMFFLRKWAQAMGEAQQARRSCRWLRASGMDGGLYLCLETMAANSSARERQAAAYRITMSVTLFG